VVREVTKIYQVWLAGYYDDFNGARAIPDNLQLPSDTSYSVAVSHFGNPMNGEASLNPRYRFSIADRKLINSTHVSGVDGDNQYLRNNGVFEWLTLDSKRNNSSEWEGRVQLQYPDGHVANRYRFGGSTSEGNVGYQRFVNGHDTNSSYIISVGDNDATFGRADMKRFDATNFAAENAGFISTTGNFSQRAHLTGSWMGEKLVQSSSVIPSKVFAEVTSPSKKPFLCVQTTRKAHTDSQDIPTIIYDGKLNTQLDRDVFTTRLALRSFIAEGSSQWDEVGIKFEIGFPTPTSTVLTSDAGHAGIPAVTYNLDLSNTFSGIISAYDSYGLLYDGSNLQSYSNDDAWLDIDFVMKYSTGKFDVYVNGTRVVLNGSMPQGTNTVASSLYGWQMTVNSQESSNGNFGYVSYLMLDRVGMVRYLTDDITTSDEVQIQSVRLNKQVNGISNFTAKVTDEADRAANGDTGLNAGDYVESVTDLFTSSSPLDWEVLFFADKNNRIDRPLYRGDITNFKIDQRKRERSLTFSAQDSLSFLGKQVPLWEIGQENLNDEAEETPYWLYDAKGFKDIMNLGASKLKITNNDVGFDVNSSYLETSTQRTQQNSGLPIQMYNNENEIFGPNSIEENYEGLHILGFQKDASGNTLVHLSSATHEISTSTAIDIVSKNHNATSITPTAVSGALLTFASGDLSFSAETAKIIYIGNQQSALPSYDEWVNFVSTGTDYTYQDHANAWGEFKENHPKYSDISSHEGPHFMNVYYDADPSLNIHDYFYINKEAMDNSTGLSSAYIGRHKVKSVYKIVGYFNNYDSTVTATGITHDTQGPQIESIGSINWSATPLWVVQTFTEYPFEYAEHGSYAPVSRLANAAVSGATAIILDDASLFPTNGTAEMGGSNSPLMRRTITWTNRSNNTLTGVSGITSAYGLNTPVFVSPVDFDTMLTLTDRFEWSKDYGRVESSFFTDLGAPLRHRAIHAKWMRDLPNSLWFRYQFGKIAEEQLGSNYDNQLLISTSVTPSTTTIEITSAAYSAASSSGVAEIWDNSTFIPNRNVDAFKGKFVYEGKINTNNKYYLIGCKYINFTVSGSTNKIKFQNISDDYKHLWLLWADMRNNGLADADGSKRKKAFGLQYPLEDNYNINMYYADQFDADGNIDTFGSLEVNKDISIWNLDTTIEPITNKPFSKPVNYSDPKNLAITNPIQNDGNGKLRINGASTPITGFANGDLVYLVGTASHDGYHTITNVQSNYLVTSSTFTSATMSITGGSNSKGYFYTTTGSDQDYSQYKDWETKGGALLIIDSSPFFNLNSNINGGRTGMVSGLGTDLGDYVQVRQGFPALIDNYWAEATASYQTTSDITGGHPAQYRLISTATLASDGFIKNDKGIPIDDATDFDDTGVGKLITVFGSGENRTTETYYFAWHNKLGTKYTSPSSVDSNPIVSTIESFNTFTTITNASAGHVTAGLKQGMLIKKIRSGVYTREYIIEVISETVLKVSGTWAAGDTYEVPVQLGKIFMVAEQNITESAGTDLTSLEQNIWDIHTSTSQTWDDYGIITNYDLTEDSTKPTSMEVHATVHSQYMLRLLMHIEGDVKNKNSGTFWESDKFRTLWNASIMDTWLPPTTVRTMYDINNVPITSNMTTYNSTSSNDSYGSIVNSKGKTFLSTIQNIRSNSGVGTENNLNTSFSFLIGRDNRFEFRPKYNSGKVLSRNNIRISNMSATTTSQITNVRVYYNNGKSFVDYPATNLTDSTRWKILEYPTVTQSLEAQILAKKQYNTYKEKPLKITASPILEEGEQYKMIGTGRYGYIADSYVALEGTDDDYTKVCNWTRLGTGGALFNGMVNALDGNQKTSTDLYARYGISKDVTTSGDIPWADNFYWYGSGSISNAVQIVHIPNNTPFVSDNYGEPMRIWIDLKASQESDATIDTAEFTIHVADYSFVGETRAIHPTNKSVASVNVKHSGFYELALPSTYSDTSVGNMVVSFNAEYCRALLRHRCGDPTDANILAQVATNTNTIFPLGMREYSEMGGGFKTTRAEWYAPKILITRDVSYTPATYVSFTDAGLGLNSETLVIKALDWSINAGKTEDVTLNLERDESIATEGFMSFLFPEINQNIQGGSSSTQGTSTGISQGVYGEGGYVPIPNNPSNVALDDDTQKNKDGRDDGNEESIATFSNKKKSAILNNHNRMNIQNDMLSGDSKFSILGQTPIPPTPSSMRGIEGMSVDITPISGTAIRTAEGYVFAGKGLQASDSSSISNQEVSIQTSFVVPKDVLSNRISISACVSHGGVLSLMEYGILYVTIECLEDTGKNITNTINVSRGLNKQNIILMPTTSLKGVDVIGNNIKVTISRVPATANDTANESSIILHDLEVKMHRASAHTPSSSAKFSTLT